MKIKQFGNIDVKEWFIYFFAFLAVVQLMAGILGTVISLIHAMLILGIAAAGAVILYKQLMKKGSEKKYRQGDFWLAISLIVAGLLLFYFMPPSVPMSMYSVFR